MPEPAVERDPGGSHLRLRCRCGWEGHDDEVRSWSIQPAHDRVVRNCPRCDTAVPEWGALGPITGVARVARGPLAEALAVAGYASDDSG